MSGKQGSKKRKCVVVFGPPAVGCTSMCAVLKESSHAKIAVVDMGVDVDAAIEEAEGLLESSDLVLVDVQGGLLTVADVQAINDARLITRDAGAFVRVHATDAMCMARATGRDEEDGAEEPYITEDDLALWRQRVPYIERRIYDHSLPYYMVSNVDLAEATISLALRAGLKK